MEIHPLNKACIFFTLFVFIPAKLTFFKLLHPENIFSIFSTFSVLIKDKSTSNKFSLCSNKLDISVTKDVSKFNFIYWISEHEENKLDIFLTFILSWETSKLDNELQESNIWEISSISAIFQFLMDKSFKDSHLLNM